MRDEPCALRSTLRRLSPFERQAVRLVLDGSSVVDWHNIPLENEREARKLLALGQLDARVARDRAWLRRVVDQAAQYLREVHAYDLPDEIARAGPLRLLLWASGLAETAPRERKLACVLLKVIHIQRHLLAHRLLSTLPESDLHERVAERIEAAARALRRRHLLIEATVDAKSTASVISKLLVSPRTHASRVFDHLRCRFVVPKLEDIVSTIVYFIRNLFPFQYVVPCQSKNSLVPTAQLFQEERGASLARPSPRPVAVSATKLHNEHTGRTFRTVQFVAEIPLRVDDAATSPWPSELGHTVFIQTEFQLVDLATERENERGENSHAAYKARQVRQVRRRLEGL